MEKIFAEAISHSRRKTLLKNIINGIQLSEYKNKTFQEIFNSMSLFKQYGDIGPLTIYDLSSGICRHHGVSIDKIYIIGKGPIRAAKLLNLKCKKINGLKYVEIKETIDILNKKNIILPENIKTTTNGDDIETFLCKWQKNN